MTSAQLSPKDDIDFEMVRMNEVPTTVKRLDERTVEYSEGVSATRVTLIYADNPWVQRVDPGLYQQWVQELGVKPVSFLVCTAEQFSGLCEYLLMHIAHRQEVRHKGYPVAAWDFQVREFAPVEFIDWNHVIAVIEGREAPYGPNNPRPEDMTEEQFEERWKHLDEPKKKRFWRRGLFSFELIQTLRYTASPPRCSGVIADVCDKGDHGDHRYRTLMCVPS